ncbi:MAG: hypothetical protein AB2A00_17750 [Myxococcota bacterium]
MSALSGYRIVDEPRPTGLAAHVCNPMWVLLASMVAGLWLSAPWFIFNAFAMGSSSRVREALWVVAAPVASLTLLFLLVVARRAELLPSWAVPYCMVVIITTKLGLAYRVFQLQQQGYALHQYFGAPVRNALPLVLVGALLRPKVLGLVDSVIWLVLVG